MKAPKVTLYDFNGLSLRVVKIDGEPWFVGSDVLKALYGRASGWSHVYDPLGRDEKTKVKRSHFAGMAKGPDVFAISESGLYKLITRSGKAEAKPFQEWVTRDVLPPIRKNGSYGAKALAFCMAS